MTSYFIVWNEGTASKADVIQHNSFNKFSTNKTFLQMLPVTISNKNHFIHINFLLDTGSSAILLTKDSVVRLSLKGSSKWLTITNALLQTSELDSELIKYEISSVSCPNKINIENTWLGADLDINYKILDIDDLKLKK